MYTTIKSELDLSLPHIKTLCLTRSKTMVSYDELAIESQGFKFNPLRPDHLGLAQYPKLLSQLADKYVVIFSTPIQKYNEDLKCQTRIFLLTNMAVYNIQKTDNIIKSIVKRLINLQNGFTIKRRIGITTIYGVSLSPKPDAAYFLLHVIHEHDYHYKAMGNRMELLQQLVEQYYHLTDRQLDFFLKEQIVLGNYCTSKTHLKLKKDYKPKDKSVTISELDDLIFYPLHSLFVLEYSQKGDNVKLANFRKIHPSYYNKNDKIYRWTYLYGPYKPITIKFKHHKLYGISYLFSNSSYNRLIELDEFMPGGNLRDHVYTRGKLTLTYTVFYVSQMILFLESAHANNFIYAAMSLYNTFIKGNGYLVFGDKPSYTQHHEEGTVLFNISGLSCYVPPECIYCTGYNMSLDVWRLGLCAYEMLIGYLPFSVSNIKQLFQEILNFVLYEDLPAFISRLLDKDPTSRAKLSYIKQMSYFDPINWQKLNEEYLYAPFVPQNSDWKDHCPALYRMIVNEANTS